MVNLKDKFKKIPPEKVADLELITDKIIQTGLAEMVILYGSHARGDYKDGKPKKEDPSIRAVSDYDLLVLVDKPDEEEPIDKRLSLWKPVMVGDTYFKITDAVHSLGLPAQVIVEQIKRVNRLIEDRQFFFLDIQKEGKILYDTGNCTLAEPPEQVTPTVRRAYAEAHFEQWFGKAEDIYAEKRKNFQLAAFDLEQVVEMCYKCIALVYTHYAADEHDLLLLRAEAEKYKPQLKKVFPIETEEQKKDFDKLSRAYIGTRYIEGFTITKEEIAYWQPESEKLLTLTEQSCKEKIEGLKLIEKEWKNKATGA